MLAEDVGPVGSDWIIAPLIDANTYFGDMREVDGTDILTDVTGENGFNGGVCDASCGPRAPRDFDPTDLVTSGGINVPIDMSALGLSTTHELFRLDVTELFKEGAITGVGVYIGRIGDDGNGGVNIRLSDFPDTNLRPALHVTIPEPGTGMLLGGDANGDGVVDVADLIILGANWSASQTTGNASALVPEPTMLSLLAMSVLVVGRRRR